jgi:hypothetical protein
MNRRSSTGERGSVVLFVLFVCVAIAVLVQTLSVIVMCADRGAEAEDRGRQLMSDKDQALAGVRQELLSSWAPRGWSTASEGAQDVETAIAELAESGGWALRATARQSAEVSSIEAEAWVEKGRDGLDLPLAGLVAADARWTAGRATPWLEMDGPVAADAGDSPVEGRPTAWLQTVPPAPLFGQGVVVASLRAAWRLDGGWRALLEAPGGAGTATDGIGPASATTVLRGRRGTTVPVPAGWGAAEGQPTLLVVMGGASLDATGRGDLCGVIVVDDGAVLLDGTRVHGAVLATGTVDLGTSGEVLFVPATLRWATDRSFVRTRLVPGSRRETIE